MAGVQPCCRCLMSVQVAKRIVGALIQRPPRVLKKIWVMNKEMSSHEEEAAPAAPEILDPHLSPAGDFVEEARANSARIRTRVAANIARLADRMVARSVKALRPLVVGDIVRISVLASARIRRKLKTVPHFRGRVGSWWTQSLFRVVRIRPSGVTQLYKMEPLDSGAAVCHGIDWSQWLTRAYLKYAPVVHSARWRS